MPTEIPTEWTMALLGGLLIGAASVLMLFVNGRIFGVSGILGGALKRAPGDTSWRVATLAGLLVGGFALTLVYPDAFDAAAVRPIGLTALAGLLVGFGTSLGGGCTSGHGVCGISRFSVRSIVATLTFIAAGVVTTTLVRLLGA